MSEPVSAEMLRTVQRIREKVTAEAEQALATIKKLKDQIGTNPTPEDWGAVRLALTDLEHNIQRIIPDEPVSS